jgi:hypothetical protein
MIWISATQHCVLCLCLCEVARCSVTYCPPAAPPKQSGPTPLWSAACWWVTINYDDMCLSTDWIKGEYGRRQHSVGPRDETATTIRINRPPNTCLFPMLSNRIPVSDGSTVILRVFLLNRRLWTWGRELWSGSEPVDVNFEAALNMGKWTTKRLWTWGRELWSGSEPGDVNYEVALNLGTWTMKW